MLTHITDSKDIDYEPSKAAMAFRASWDYMPIPLLKLIKYIPANPFTRLRNLDNLFKEYGRQILREQGPGVDTEKAGSSKDIVRILSEYFSIDVRPSRLPGSDNSYS